jgi:Arc/MetJ-type ribon-helix-helix transcriptional regulator
MGKKKRMSTSLPEKQAERIEEEVEQLDMSKSEYIRQMVMAGRLVFKTGKLDTELLDDLVETNGTERLEQDVETLDDDISQQILSILPSDEGRSMTEDEIRLEIFGNQDEQESKIEKTLKALNEQGMVRRAFQGGFVTDE